MPELPEVETVRQTLRNLIIGKEITEVLVFHKNIVESDLDEFTQKLVGQVFTEVERVGKYLIFELSDYELISHLRMEGKYFLTSEYEKTKHDHVIFAFKDGSYLKYNDTRKFGKMSLVDKGMASTSKQISKLGYEPFDQRLNKEDLFLRLQRTQRPIKTSLLDQTIIAGLGNIYVDEVLFMSKIDPRSPSNDLSIKECQIIIENAIIVLDKAIHLGGTTIHSYESSEGVTGLFQNQLLVHTKVGEDCPICKTTIEKIKVGGRGTYYCKNCQK